MTVLYFTCKNEREARKISIHLLNKRLIACANIFPIKSMYRWNGKVVNDKEYAVIAKTSGRNFKKAAAEIKNMHSYKIPCIIRINAKANKDYEEWVTREIR